MASKQEKVIDKATLTTLARKLIICGRSVSWCDEELHQLVKDHRACFTQGLYNDSNWSDYLRIHKELLEKERKKENLWRRSNGKSK